MKCSYCGRSFQEGSNVCPWCGKRVLNVGAEDKKEQHKHAANLSEGRQKNTKESAAVSYKRSGHTRKRKSKTRLWHLIIFASLFCLFTAFLPLGSVYSDTLAARIGWDLRGVYMQVNRLDDVLESDALQSLTDDGMIEGLVKSVSGIDTGEIVKMIRSIRQSLFLIYMLVVGTLAINLLCAGICLLRKEILNVIFSLLACFCSIGTVVYINVFCSLEASKVEAVEKVLENVEPVIGISISEVVDFAQLKPGAACIILLAMAFISIVTLIIILCSKIRNQL